MLSTKLALIALAVAATLTAGIPTGADYLTGPDTEFIEPSPADVMKPAELSQFLGPEPAMPTTDDVVPEETTDLVTARCLSRS